MLGIRNLKRVFADHIFFSEKIIEDLEKLDDKSYLKALQDSMELFKQMVEEGGCDNGPLSRFKPTERFSSIYYIDSKDLYVEFVCYREKIGRKIYATISYANDNETPECITERVKGCGSLFKINLKEADK